MKNHLRDQIINPRMKMIWTFEGLCHPCNQPPVIESYNMGHPSLLIHQGTLVRIKQPCFNGLYFY